MAKLEIAQAPPTALPRRFLESAPVWGVLAGLLLAADGAVALQSRWAPGTLALVHALTLGVLGNAMFGGLLQFLPAAAGVRVRGGVRAGWILHGALNIGTALLVAGFHAMRPVLLLGAAAVLAGAFALLAALLLPGLIAAHGRALLRASLAGAVAAAAVTAALGVAMLLGLAGQGGLPLWPWADVHAAWGVLGWGVGLLAGVGTVVLPMFQGTRELPVSAQRAWLGLLAVLLPVGTASLALAQRGTLLRWGVVGGLAAFAVAGLWLQWRAPRTRNAWLVRSWRLGLVTVLGGAAVLALQGPAVLAGVLVLAIGLPALVAGMQLEIGAFLGWIELHRRCGRGVRLPSVQALLPERHKAGVFVAQAMAALWLLAAAASPQPITARVAGLALAASQGLLWLRLRGVDRRVRAFHAKAPRTTAPERSHAH